MTRPTFLAAGFLCASVLALATGCGGGSGGDGGAGGAGGGGNPVTGSAKLSWTAPTTRTDGSPLTDLAGYRIYYDTSRTGFRNRIELNNPSAITWTVTDLAPGTWYFAMTALDSRGLESDRTNAVSKTIP